MNRFSLSVASFSFLLLSIGLSLGSASVSAESTGNLTVQLSQIDTSKGGSLRIALFRGEQGWPKLKNAFRQQRHVASQQQLAIRFTDLPYSDDYAIEVHHDENDNGKFDMRWLPYPRPKEGVGVSNNSFGIGHPDFADARFPISQPEQQLRIQLNY